MAAAVEKQWGTTPPISTTLPTPQELAANDALIAELKEQNNFESPEETERRYAYPLLHMILRLIEVAGSRLYN